MPTKTNICIEQLEGYLLNSGATAHALEDDVAKLIVPVPTIRFTTPDGDHICPIRITVHADPRAVRLEALSVLPNIDIRPRAFMPMTARCPHGFAGVPLMLTPRPGPRAGRVALVMLVAVPVTGFSAAIFKNSVASFRSMADRWAARFQSRSPHDRFPPPTGDNPNAAVG